MGGIWEAEKSLGKNSLLILAMGWNILETLGEKGWEEGIY